MKRITSGFFLLAILFAGTSLVAAHGGGDLIARSVQTGPYTASIWVNPPDPRAKEVIHFTVGLASPEDGSPVLDADILVVMRHADSGETAATAPATTEQSVNKLFYETDIEVPVEGDYEVEFQVSGTEGEGTVSLTLEVKESSRVNWLVIGFAGLGIVLVFGWWRSRRMRSGEPHA
jgi:hypothetical protein